MQQPPRVITLAWSVALACAPIAGAEAARCDSRAGVSTPAVAPDPDIDAALVMLTGSFATDAQAPTEAEPALQLHAAAVAVEGLGHTLYFELARADDPANPFRQGIMQLYRRQGQLRLRLLDLGGNAGIRDAIVGLWAAPEVFPSLQAEQLSPNLDLPLTRSGSTFAGRNTANPCPSTRGGAVEMTSEVTISPDTLTIADRGFDADGKQVWGPAAGSAAKFARTTPTITADKREGGLTVIDLVPPPVDAPRLTPGGDVAVHYSGWLTDGTRFDTSRNSQRGPFRTRVPAEIFKGWNDGLMGIAKGTRRRIYIPADMAYGANGRGPIPPNAPLIFDVECMWMENAPPVPPAAPAPPPPEPAPPPPGGK